MAQAFTLDLRREGPSTWRRTVPCNCRPFAFYVTDMSPSANIDRLYLGSDMILENIPASLLLPHADDRLDADPVAVLSNIGDHGLMLPGQTVEAAVSGLIGTDPTALRFRAVLVATRESPADFDEQRRRGELAARLAREHDLAARFFAALITGAERERKPAETFRPTADLAREMAAEFMRSQEDAARHTLGEDATIEHTRFRMRNDVR